MADETAPAEVNLGDIARLIQDMSGKVEQIGQRVTSLEQSKPQVSTIRPMDPPEDLSAARREAFARARGLQKGGEAEGVVQIPLDSKGHRLPPGAIMPRFHGDDLVRIRRDVAREGFPKAGDPFPEKYIIGRHGARRLNQAWRKWSPIFPGATDEFPRDVVWADLLDAARCSGAGVVKFADFISKLGEWKYKVYVKGLTRKGGDGMYEYEISAVNE